MTTRHGSLSTAWLAGYFLGLLGFCMLLNALEKGGPPNADKRPGFFFDRTPSKSSSCPRTTRFRSGP